MTDKAPVKPPRQPTRSRNIPDELDAIGDISELRALVDDLNRRVADLERKSTR
jgi:polyhydroxyalkanoate synthesis regulator phasin